MLERSFSGQESKGRITKYVDPRPTRGTCHQRGVAAGAGIGGSEAIELVAVGRSGRVVVLVAMDGIHWEGEIGSIGHSDGVVGKGVTGRAYDFATSDG